MAEFPIFELPLAKGVAALGPIPGRTGAYEADVSALLRWAPDLVISMTGVHEMDRVGASEMSKELVLANVDWRHVPITDFGIPTANTEETWASVQAQALDVLERGGRVFVHCYGGCGRSGMAILRLMVRAGEDPNSALARLRAARPCAVETDAQFAWASGVAG